MPSACLFAGVGGGGDGGVGVLPFYEKIIYYKSLSLLVSKCKHTTIFFVVNALLQLMFQHLFDVARAKNKKTKTLVVYMVIDLMLAYLAPFNILLFLLLFLLLFYYDFSYIYIYQYFCFFFLSLFSHLFPASRMPSSHTSPQMCRPHFHTPLSSWLTSEHKSFAPASPWGSPFACPQEPQVDHKLSQVGQTHQTTTTGQHSFPFPPTPPKDSTPDSVQTGPSEYQVNV